MHHSARKRNKSSRTLRITTAYVILTSCTLSLAQSTNLLFEFNADSLHFDYDSQTIKLIGNATVTSGNLSLSAPLIVVNWKNQTFKAFSDSTTPAILKQNKKTFTLDSAVVNIQTQKALVYHLWTVTWHEELALGGNVVKRTFQKTRTADSSQEVYYLAGGFISTCDLPKPHYALYVEKAKWIPGKLAVSGSARLKVLDIPVPVFIPFFILPLHKKGHSGFLIPAIGESFSQGFVLRSLGYYLVINDYLHLALIGDVYTSGTYNASLQALFKKRYVLSGSLKLSFARTLTGYPFLPETKEFKDVGFFLELKAGGPMWRNISINSSIKLTTRTYWLNTSYDPQNFLQNNLASGLHVRLPLGKLIDNNISLLQRLNTHTGQVLLSIPQLNSYMRRISLLRKNKLQVWISSTTQFIHSWQLSDTAFFTYIIPLNQPSDTIPPGTREWILTNSTPVGLTARILRYLSLTIQANNSATFAGVDSLNTIAWLYSLRTSAGISTALYGFFNLNGRIKAIRHIVKPSIQIQSTPLTIIPPDSTPSPILNRISTSPGTRLIISLSNRLDIKWITKENKTRKGPLIPDLSLRTAYDPASDSLEPLLTSLRITIPGKNISMLIQTRNNWYQPAFLKPNYTQLSMSLSGIKPLPYKSTWGDAPSLSISISALSTNGVQWQASLQGSIRWQLTKLWNLELFSGYNFTLKQPAYTRLRITRDLHCWELSMEWIPLGSRSAYFLILRPKALILGDIKIQHRREWFEGNPNL